MKMSEMPFSPDFFTVLAVCWSNEPPPDALKKKVANMGFKMRFAKRCEASYRR